MIINGGSRRNGRFFAKHLTNGEDNERVSLCDMRNLAADNIAGALQEMQAVALGTMCSNYFYHANLNPQQSEELTPQQWEHAVVALEKNLGLEGHARFVVEHHKKGRTHRHVIWLRIDVRTMRAVTMTDDYEKHQATARHLEKEFDLQCGRSVLGKHKQKGGRPARRPQTWETFRGHKSGIDPLALTAHVTALYRASANAEAFSRALTEHGYRLAKGDRRDFCILDRAGHVHSLSKRLDGVRVAELLRFMRKMMREPLPNPKRTRRSEQPPGK